MASMALLHLLFVPLSFRWLIVAAMLESFTTDQVTDVTYIDRDEQINTLYNTWAGYGLDCYHHINQDMSLRLYFRGRVIAEAKVRSCSRNMLSQAIVIMPFKNGKHNMRVCVEDHGCIDYEFNDPHQDIGDRERVTKPTNKLPRDDTSCANEWCRFGDLDQPLKSKIFYPLIRTKIN